MNCPACGNLATSQQRFCGDCGLPLNGGLGQAVSTGGGDIYDGVYQAGRDVVVNPVPSEHLQACYEAVPKWRSPFTQGVLSWLGLLLGLAGLFPLWKVLAPILQVHKMGLGALSQAVRQEWWLLVFAALFLLFVLIVSLRRMTKHELRYPLLFNWAVSGRNRRITLEKIFADACPLCGGELRYRNKVVEWIDYREGNGGRKRREVIRREPVLECVRNPEHSYKVDPAVKSP